MGPTLRGPIQSITLFTARLPRSADPFWRNVDQAAVLQAQRPSQAGPLSPDLNLNQRPRFGPNEVIGPPEYENANQAFLQVQMRKQRERLTPCRRCPQMCIGARETWSIFRRG